MATEVVHKCFYVDDCLTGAKDSKSALFLQQQLTRLLARGGFTLRKWNSNDPSVSRQIPEGSRDSRDVQFISEGDKCSKTLGIEWNVGSDQLRISVAELPLGTELTKRKIVSDVSKIFDVLGFFSPSTIKMRILLQRLWEIKLDWDDTVPKEVKDVWNRWRSELPLLTTVHVPRCYLPGAFSVVCLELHGFSDVSEEAYAAVVYVRLTSLDGKVHIMSRTKVSPIKRLSMPRLELCGAHLLTKLICHVKKVLDVSTTSVFAWTDSTIVLRLAGNLRRFKTYVDNRISLLLLSFLQIDGDMLQEFKTQQTVPPEACFLWNLRTICSGGTDLSGYDWICRTGQFSLLSF